MRGILFLLLGSLALARPAEPRSDAERLHSAKVLLFDGRYGEARDAWQAIADGGGPEATDARYHVARCSEGLKEHERALREYEVYLQTSPSNVTLAEEARAKRVSLATRLYKAGHKKQHLKVLLDALEEPSQTVRYFAALQLSGLGPNVGLPAVSVLQSILRDESDEDLIERAQLGLLRLDPKALTEAQAADVLRGGRNSLTPRVRPRPRRSSTGQWVKVRIYERGDSKPEVSLNFPVALAEMLFKSLPDSARGELRRRGYESETFFDRLREMGRTDILKIEERDGSRVEIWIE